LTFKKGQTKLNKEIDFQKLLLSQLKQSILQEAIQGKLTESWRKQNPTTEPASELLKRIKAEKAQLIKEKKIKKEKPLPKISKEEIPFELPKSWVWCRLGEIIILKSGQDLTPSEYNTKEKGIPYLTGASHIYDNKINLSRWTETPKSISEKGDLLITCKGTIGKMIFNSIEKIHIARQIMAINTVVDFELKFIKYFLQDFTKILLKNAKSLIPGISRDDILHINFPFPPLSEQKEIVKKVGSLMQHCQDLGQEIQTSEANAKILMQAVLKEAFESKENKPIKM
jgi:type I restriction enzyme S subunit